MLITLTNIYIDCVDIDIQIILLRVEGLMNAWAVLLRSGVDPKISSGCIYLDKPGTNRIPLPGSVKGRRLVWGS